MTEASPYLTAQEAAAALGVRPQTLYAYVSRGLIRSEAAERRERRYHAEDITRLRRKRDGDPALAAEAALSFGAPVLDSAITLILEDRLYYRGQDAGLLARHASIRSVAALLWQADAAVIFAPEICRRKDRPSPPPGGRWTGLAPIERCLALLPVAAAADARALDLAPPAVAGSGARILRLLTAVVAQAEPSARPVDAVLAEAWGLGASARPLLRAALILVRRSRAQRFRLRRALRRLGAGDPLQRRYRRHGRAAGRAPWRRVGARRRLSRRGAFGCRARRPWSRPICAAASACRASAIISIAARIRARACCSSSSGERDAPLLAAGAGASPRR